jgi:4-amino-4-deoxychorismate lyase
VNVWINGRRRTTIDCRDRGLQYGDGVFETMRVRGRQIRLLELHLDRLYRSCRTLKIQAPRRLLLRRELAGIAGRRHDGILKLIITRGSGPRGYRPTGNERCMRIASLHALTRGAAKAGAAPVRLRVCTTVLGSNPKLAGLKTLNRLDSVLARAEWRDARIWEGLMRDAEGNFVCGTMSNLFLRRGDVLTTPVLDRCGVAGVMRRWIVQRARALNLRILERRVRRPDLESADEVFMCNAVAGIRSVGSIQWTRARTTHFRCSGTADLLRSRLDAE